MSHLLSDILFAIPDDAPADGRVVVTAALVEERLAGLVQKRDVSEFIL